MVALDKLIARQILSKHFFLKCVKINDKNKKENTRVNKKPRRAHPARAQYKPLFN